MSISVRDANGVSVRIASVLFSDGSQAATTAHSLVGVALSPGANFPGPIIDFEQGRLILTGLKTNATAYSTIQVGSGVGIGALIVSGSDIPNVTQYPWDSTAHSRVLVSGSLTGSGW